METWEAIRSRRNVRQFEDRPLPPEDLDQILEAGRRAPSSRNWQPWDFVVVTDRDQLGELAKVWQGAFHVAQSAATIALVAPVVASDDERAWLNYDLGQATAYLMLEATDLGIGTAHAWVSDQDQARRVLRLPADHFLAYVISMGYPADRPLTPIQRPQRRPFDDVVHRGGW
jgi:nitroreductase